MDSLESCQLGQVRPTAVFLEVLYAIVSLGIAGAVCSRSAVPGEVVAPPGMIVAMKLLRTPEDRFDGLLEFQFTPRYAYVHCEIARSDDMMRVHFLDEGPPDGEVVVLLHGEPSWSYLYRTMIPVLTGAGLRCVACDLVGFGRSDKPALIGDYSYARHVEWMREMLFDALDLRNVTLVCQDWGGLIGLRLVAEHPERFARVVAANTGLPTGREQMSDAFFAWQRFSQEVPELPIGRIIAGGCSATLDDRVIAAYEAPFPNESYKAGARVFPALVPTSLDDPQGAANERAWAALSNFDRPFLTVFSDLDPITRGADALFQERVPGARGQQHVTIEGAGHFLQEDMGPELACVISDFIDRSLR